MSWLSGFIKDLTQPGWRQAEAQQQQINQSNAIQQQNYELAQKNQMQFPTVIGGVVPVVNIAGIAPGQLKLTGELIADIFLAKITKWNDAAVKALNPSLNLPDAAIAPVLLPALITDLRALGCDFRADEAARAIVPDLKPATDEDFATEWLDAILSVKVVSGVAEALTHIRRFGSEHTEAIITEDAAAAQQFLDGIASAVGLWNASTQFCDGGEFGFGAEIGIATGRLHARGPVGLEQLCTYRYKIFGTGQVRP